MSSIFPYVLLYLAGVFFSSCAQILLKKEADQTHEGFLSQYLNPRVIIGYCIFFACMLLNMVAYRGGVPVHLGPVLETAGYVFVTVLGVTILREKITKKKVLALCVIIAGILLYAI